MTNFDPSPQQLAIRDWVASGQGHGSVRSCAGSGKTTTLAYICSALPFGTPTVALSFGKDAAEQLKSRLPFFVQSTTTHSYFFTALKKAIGGYVKVDDKKSNWILKDLIPDWKDRSEIQSECLKLVGYAKANAYGHPEAPSLETLSDSYGLDASPKILSYAERVLEISKDKTNQVDYDDMLWLPLVKGIPIPTTQWVLVDEAQDLNLTQRLLIPKLLNPNSRLLIVGDPNQAIYGFRGAGTESMELLEKQLSMSLFSLSVSYRCSQTVVKEAQRYLEMPLQKRIKANLGISHEPFEDSELD